MTHSFKQTVSSDITPFFQGPVSQFDTETPNIPDTDSEPASEDSDGSDPSDSSEEEKDDITVGPISAPLYPGSSFSLSDFIHFMSALRGRHKTMTQACLVDIYDAFRLFLPTGNSVLSYLRTKRKFRQVNEDIYRRIDMCVNDCVLFHDSSSNPNMRHAGKVKCPECQEPRFFPNTRLARKHFFHISLIEQLRTLFQDRSLAPSLHFTKERRTDGFWDDISDSDGFWASWQQDGFNKDNRNQCLAVSVDGVNPFKHVQSSMWPVSVQVCRSPVIFVAAKSAS